MAIASQADEAGLPELPGAGFQIRAAARILDMFFLFCLSAVGGGVGGLVTGVMVAVGLLPETALSQLEGRVSLFGSYFWGAAAGLLFHALCEAIGNATPGKLLCGLRVISEWREPCTLGGALIRNVAYYFDGLFFGLIAYTAMEGSISRQRHGDHWGKTIVLKAAAVPAQARRSGGLVALGIVGACLSTTLFSAAGLMLLAL